MARSFCPVREDSALIIVDYQDAILKTFDQKIQDQLHRQTKLCIQMAQQLQLPIIVFEQYPKGLGATNEEIRELLGPDYQPLAKKVFSGAGLITDKLAAIDRRQLLIIGIETHICVMQTVLYNYLNAAEGADFKAMLPYLKG